MNEKESHDERSNSEPENPFKLELGRRKMEREREIKRKGEQERGERERGGHPGFISL